MSARIWTRSFASRLDSGSSIRKAAGSRTIARPIATAAADRRKLAGFAGEEWLEAEQLRHLEDAALPLVLVHACNSKREADVRLHGQIGIERVVLEHHRDVALLRRKIGHVPSSDVDRPHRPPRGRRASAGRSSSRSPKGRPGRRTPCPPRGGRGRRLRACPCPDRSSSRDRSGCQPTCVLSAASAARATALQRARKTRVELRAGRARVERRRRSAARPPDAPRPPVRPRACPPRSSP